MAILEGIDKKNTVHLIIIAQWEATAIGQLILITLLAMLMMWGMMVTMIMTLTVLAMLNNTSMGMTFS